MSDFGFSVNKKKDKDEWSVLLPHSCDSWGIVGDDWDYVPHDKAVAELTSFIAEATDALVKLTNREEHQGEL